MYPTDFSGDARDLNQSDRRQYPSPFAAAAHAWQEGNLNNMGGLTAMIHSVFLLHKRWGEGGSKRHVLP